MVTREASGTEEGENHLHFHARTHSSVSHRKRSRVREVEGLRTESNSQTEVVDHEQRNGSVCERCGKLSIDSITLDLPFPFTLYSFLCSDFLFFHTTLTGEKKKEEERTLLVWMRFSFPLPLLMPAHVLFPASNGFSSSHTCFFGTLFSLPSLVLYSLSHRH